MNYDKFYRSRFGRFALRKEAEYIAKEMNGFILSVGCGTGIIEREVEKIGHAKIIGIEKDDEMLEIARKRINVIKGDAEWLPFANSRFDGIVFVTSLEFIDDYEKTIEEAYRVLKPEGKIVAMLLNTYSKYFQKMMEKGGYVAGNIKHTNMEKIEAKISSLFKTQHEYIICMNMEEDCGKEEKTIYAVKGIKLA